MATSERTKIGTAACPRCGAPLDQGASSSTVLEWTCGCRMVLDRIGEECVGRQLAAAELAGLARCPWCGERPVLRHEEDGTKWWYSCDNFDCPVRTSTRRANSEAVARKLWNGCARRWPSPEDDDAHQD